MVMGVSNLLQKKAGCKHLRMRKPRDLGPVRGSAAQTLKKPTSSNNTRIRDETVTVVESLEIEASNSSLSPPHWF